MVRVSAETLPKDKYKAINCISFYKNIHFRCLYFFLPPFPPFYFSSSKKMLKREDKRSHNSYSYSRISLGTVGVPIREWYDLVLSLKRS